MPNNISHNNRNFLIQMVGRGIVFNCGHQKLQSEILRNDYQDFKQFADEAPIGVSLTYTSIDDAQQYKITVIEPQEPFTPNP